VAIRISEIQRSLGAAFPCEAVGDLAVLVEIATSRRLIESGLVRQFGVASATEAWDTAIRPGSARYRSGGYESDDLKLTRASASAAATGQRTGYIGSLVIASAHGDGS
jgi:hypothetical protein